MDLWEHALSFMNSQILLTAEEVGVFRHLASGPRNSAEMAAVLGLPGDSTERLLNALCALGIINKLPDGRLVNGPEAAEQLVPGRPGYIGAMFHHVKHALYPAWGYFKEALVEGTAQWERAFSDKASPCEQMYTDSRALCKFMDGMHVITYEAATEFASYASELKRIESVVDVGGASGAFVIAVAERHPSMRGTVLDLPPVRPIAEAYFRRHRLFDRLSFHGANFWEEDIPCGADAYSLGFILHDWDMTGGSIILEKIAKAAKPGGLLIIGEYLLNDDKTGPLWVARSDLNMLVAARGRERTAAEYGEWVQRHGFKLQRIYQTSRGKNFLVARRQAAPLASG